MKHYVQVRTPHEGFLLEMACRQFAVPTGRTRETNNTIEAEFIPISKGYYTDKFWTTQDKLCRQD